LPLQIIATRWKNAKFYYKKTARMGVSNKNNDILKNYLSLDGTAFNPDDISMR
jgi:hypothetical protein